jgi:hypothetical protein
MIEDMKGLVLEFALSGWRPPAHARGLRAFRAALLDDWLAWVSRYRPGMLGPARQYARHCLRAERAPWN